MPHGQSNGEEVQGEVADDGAMASSSATCSQAVVRMRMVEAGPRFGNSARGHGSDVNKSLCVGSCGVIWTSRPMDRDPRGDGDASRKFADPELSTGNATIQGRNKDKIDLLCRRTPQLQKTAQVHQVLEKRTTMQLSLFVCCTPFCLS